MSAVQKTRKYVWELTSKAQDIWKVLNGIVAVYKPAQTSTSQIMTTLKSHLCRDLNELEVRPPTPYVHIDGETDKELSVRVEPSYADHELVVGPRYQTTDLKIIAANYLPRDISGIQLFGINHGTKMAFKLKSNNPLKFYKIKALLGQATDNFFITGRIVEKSTFDRVRRHHIDMICAAAQSGHQRKMFEACGVDIQSQAAYELAVQGPIRPTNDKIPVLYSLKCVDFAPPEFTLEIVCINEDDMFLKNLVHGLGLQLRGNATCTRILCYQYGIFNAELGLLKRDWDLQNILNNMSKVRHLLNQNKYLFDQQDPILREYMNQ